MASQEPNAPSQESSATPFDSMFNNSEVVNLMKKFYVFCNSFNTTNAKVQSIKEEKPEELQKQLTLDHWVKKGIKNGSNSNEKTSARSSSFQKKLSTGNRTEFQDDVPNENIPGTSTNEFANYIQPNLSQQCAYTISRDKLLIPVEREPDKSEVANAQVLHTLGSQGSPNSLALLVDENSSYVHQNAESAALICLDLNVENNSDLTSDLNIPNENKSIMGISSEKQIYEDVSIIYERMPNTVFLNDTNSKSVVEIDPDMSSNKTNMDNVVYVDESGNLLPVTQVKTTSISPDFLNSDLCSFYTISEPDNSEIPLPEGSCENEQRDKYNSNESDSNLNLIRSPKKKSPSFKVKTFKTVSKEMDVEISKDVSIINSPYPANSDLKERDSPSKFLYSPEQINRLARERFYAKVSDPTNSEPVEKDQNSPNNLCVIKKKLNVSECGEITVTKKQAKSSELSSNILSQNGDKFHKVNMTNKTNVRINEIDLEVGRNEELGSTTTDSNRFSDFLFDNNYVSEKNPSNRNEGDKRASVTPTERKQGKKRTKCLRSSSFPKEYKLEKQNQDILNKSYPTVSLTPKNSDESENFVADHNTSKEQCHIKKKLQSNSSKKRVKNHPSQRQKRNNRGYFEYRSTDEPRNISNSSEFQTEIYEDPSARNTINVPHLENDLSEENCSTAFYNLRRRNSSIPQTVPRMLKDHKKNESKNRNKKRSSSNKRWEFSESEDASCDSFEESVGEEAESVMVKNISISLQNNEENVRSSETESTLNEGLQSHKIQQIRSISPKCIASNKPINALSFSKSDSEASDVICQSPITEFNEDCISLSVDMECEIKKLKEKNKRKKQSFESSDNAIGDVTHGPPNKKTKHAVKKTEAHLDTLEYISEPKVSSGRKKSSKNHKKRKISIETQKQGSSTVPINKSDYTKTPELDVLDRTQYPAAKNNILPVESVDCVVDKQTNHEKHKLSGRKIETYHLLDNNGKKPRKKKISYSKSKKVYMVISDCESSENELQISTLTKSDESTAALSLAQSSDENKKEKQKKYRNLNRKQSFSSKPLNCTSKESDISLNNELNSPYGISDTNNKLNKEKFNNFLTPKQDNSKLQQTKKTYSKKEQNLETLKGTSDLKQNEKDNSKTCTKSSISIKCTKSQNDSNSPNFKAGLTSTEVANLKSKELLNTSVPTECDLTCILNQSDTRIDCHSACIPLNKEVKNSERSKKKLTEKRQNENVSGDENLDLSQTLFNKKGEENVDFVSLKDKNQKKIKFKTKSLNLEKKVNTKSARLASKKSPNDSPESDKDSIDHIFDSVLAKDHSLDNFSDEELNHEIIKFDSKVGKLNKVSALEDAQKPRERLMSYVRFTFEGIDEVIAEEKNVKLNTQQSKSKTLKNEKLKSDSNIEQENSMEISNSENSDYDVSASNMDNNSCKRACSNGKNESLNYHLLKKNIPNFCNPVVCLKKLDFDASLLFSKGNKFNNFGFKKAQSSFSDKSYEECNGKTSGLNSRCNSLYKPSSSPLEASSELFKLSSSLRPSDKGTKRKLSENLETDLAEKKCITAYERSPHSHQDLECNQLSSCSEQNKVEYTGNDLQNSTSSSCTETNDYENKLSRFLEFIRKEHKHFTKMVGTEKMANFISIVAAHPNGTVVMIPSENMEDPAGGPGLILYEKRSPRNGEIV